MSASALLAVASSLTLLWSMSMCLYRCQRPQTVLLPAIANTDADPDVGVRAGAGAVPVQVPVPVPVPVLVRCRLRRGCSHGVAGSGPVRYHFHCWCVRHDCARVTAQRPGNAMREMPPARCRADLTAVNACHPADEFFRRESLLVSHALHRDRDR